VLQLARDGVQCSALGSEVMTTGASISETASTVPTRVNDVVACTSKPALARFAAMAEP